MNNLIHIKHNDNIYIIEDRHPELNELSIYINKDKTIVSNKFKQDNGDEYNHVAVNWMYEKPGDKLAFKSTSVYVNMQIINTEVLVTTVDITMIARDHIAWGHNDNGEWMRGWLNLLNEEKNKE